MVQLHITYTEQKSAPSIDQISSVGADLMWPSEMVSDCPKEDDVQLCLCYKVEQFFEGTQTLCVVKLGH